MFLFYCKAIITLRIQTKLQNYNIMNSSIITQYYSYSAPSLKERILGLLQQLPMTHKVLSISLFGTSSNEDYHTELAEMRTHIRAHLQYLPLITYIVQPLPQSDGLAMEVHSFIQGGDISSLPIVECPNGVRYVPISLSDRELFLVEGVVSNSFDKPMRQQSVEVFERIEELLKSLDLTPSNIIRQWNYIGNITKVAHGEQHYQAFNDARSAFYAKDEWANGYPAATGIGTSCDGVVVSFVAYRGVTNESSRAIDNPLQIAAHAYNKRVLIGDEVAQKTTPKFERAKTLVYSDNRSICFVSGTAAIRGEDSLNSADAAEQTRLTIENIEYLISDENMNRHNSRARDLKMVSARVYVKRPEDFEAVRSAVESRYSDLQMVIVEADVCRSELLVEIEGVAKGGVL